ncbi:MAG: GTP 3',8-cyclase MoaA [Hyphomonadaceae bacterium]|jgi:cyclic pyranopterin phosphate synthase|nr:GTP 3',8-cyclase MoaA [Hyphomonadaceae bacterium]
MKPLVDPFGRAITYLRVSVTDRCDLRCIYCMSERMRFLPRAELLTIEELDRLCSAFVRRGVRRLRFTGGEPLVRRGFLDLLNLVKRHLNAGLDEITVTTNGVQLADFAEPLFAAGVRRVNVSIDSLDRDTFKHIARRDCLPQVLAGIDAAERAGLKIKINTVALKRDNAHEIPDLIKWAHGRGFDMTLIETMPLGEIDEDRTDQFLSLTSVREDMASYWRLTDLPDRTGGPARYVRVEETGGRLGFITPLSHNFCEACSRVRLTCTGKLYLCLGHETSVDLRETLRAEANDTRLDAILDDAMTLRPKGHDFQVERLRTPATVRHMSVTGG